MGWASRLTVKDPRTVDPNAYNDKSLWRPSAKAGGSPGTDDSGQVPALGSVVINELLANSGQESDWIELHNTTDQPINIGGWYLSDDANDLTKYKIGAGTSLAANGYLVFYENRHFGNKSDPGCKKPFGLRASGETVYLHSGSAGVLTGYSEQEKFDASEAGVSLGRYEKSTGTYNFVALSKATPGAANAAPKVGPVVINEIMYHPDTPADAEYVELLNISNEPVTLYDPAEEAPWRFSDDAGIEFLFPTNPPVTLAAGEYLLLVKDTEPIQLEVRRPCRRADPCLELGQSGRRRREAPAQQAWRHGCRWHASVDTRGPRRLQRRLTPAGFRGQCRPLAGPGGWPGLIAEPDRRHRIRQRPGQLARRDAIARFGATPDRPTHPSSEARPTPSRVRSRRSCSRLAWSGWRHLIPRPEGPRESCCRRYRGPRL